MGLLIHSLTSGCPARVGADEDGTGTKYAHVAVLTRPSSAGRTIGAEYLRVCCPVSVIINLSLRQKRWHVSTWHAQHPAKHRVTPRQRSATQATFVRRTQTRRDTPRHQRDTVSRLRQRFAFSPHAAFWWHVTAAEKALLCGFLRSEQLTFAQESVKLGRKNIP